MSTYIKGLEATGIYGRFDITQEFNEGINILHGKNGAGKTTLLHILANALSSDFERFKSFSFNTIVISLSDGNTLKITNRLEEDSNFIEANLGEEKIFPNPHDSQQVLSISADEEYRTYKAMIDADKDLSERERYELLSEIASSRRKREVIPTVQVAYFPAFRTMIEAWIAAEIKSDSKRLSSHHNIPWKDVATQRARDWFGDFTPTVNFPSLVEIEEHLTREIWGAASNVMRKDQAFLSDAFEKIFASLSGSSEVEEGMESLLSTIPALSVELEMSPFRPESIIDVGQLGNKIDLLNTGSNLETTAIRVLKIYRDFLEDMIGVRKRSFEEIERYLFAINEFLNPKTLTYIPDLRLYRRENLRVKYEDGSTSKGLRSLSSGERQIMTLVYAATHMSRQDIVLIDEPEISLHVDWQRKLISRMADQLGERQIIACTHSPVIGANHMDKMSELFFRPTKVDFPEPVDTVEDEEGPF